MTNSQYFYPAAREWMWDSCIFLGKFTDSKGQNWDLGIHICEGKYVSGAIVHGNEGGDYYSPDFVGSSQTLIEKFEGLLNRYSVAEACIETIKRAKQRNHMY